MDKLTYALKRKALVDKLHKLDSQNITSPMFGGLVKLQMIERKLLIDNIKVLDKQYGHQAK